MATLIITIESVSVAAKYDCGGFTALLTRSLPPSLLSVNAQHEYYDCSSLLSIIMAFRKVHCYYSQSCL